MSSRLTQQEDASLSQSSLRQHSSEFKSPKTKQETKHTLRSAYATTQNLYNNINTSTLKNLDNMIYEVDLINEEETTEEKVKDQSGVVLDSEIMYISSRLLHKCTFNLSKDISNYDPTEFADKVLLHLNSMTDNMGIKDCVWSLFGKDMISRFRRTPIFSSIAGTLRLVAKKENFRRTTIVRDPNIALKNPERVIIIDEEIEDNLKKTVVEIGNIIYKFQRTHKKPLDFFKLVLDPYDFGKTVENILHVSFLVRDGVVKLLIDEEGIPQVEKCSRSEIAANNEDNENNQVQKENIEGNKINKKKGKPTDENNEGKKEKKKQKVGKDVEARKNTQNVLSITMKQWKELVKAYNIITPMIR